ncbi:RNA-binding protein Cwf29 [Coniothyrium glycines]
MNSVRAIQQLNKRELEAGINPEGSWHTDYRDTAFINIGGLPFELSEGDIITIFSQYGEPVWVKLARDKETGKSRGFAWIKYEDQRSCDLAVDNLGGATIMDRVIRVDHARYKPKDDEDMRDNTMGDLDDGPARETDDSRRKRRKTESESDPDEDRPLLPEEIELERLIDKLDEDDPMRDSMIRRQQEKVEDAITRFKKQQRKEKERSRRKDKHRHRDRSPDRDRHRERQRIRDVDEDAGKTSHTRRRDRRSKSRDYGNEERSSRQNRRSDRSIERDRDGDRSRRSDQSREHHRDDKERRERHREREHHSDEERGARKHSPIPYRARSPR